MRQADGVSHATASTVSPNMLYPTDGKCLRHAVALHRQRVCRSGGHGYAWHAGQHRHHQRASRFHRDAHTRDLLDKAARTAAISMGRSISVCAADRAEHPSGTKIANGSTRFPANTEFTGRVLQVSSICARVSSPLPIPPARAMAVNMVRHGCEISCHLYRCRWATPLSGRKPTSCTLPKDIPAGAVLVRDHLSTRSPPRALPTARRFPSLNTMDKPVAEMRTVPPISTSARRRQAQEKNWLKTLPKQGYFLSFCVSTALPSHSSTRHGDRATWKKLRWAAQPAPWWHNARPFTDMSNPSMIRMPSRCALSPLLVAVALASAAATPTMALAAQDVPGAVAGPVAGMKMTDAYCRWRRATSTSGRGR